MDTPNEFLTTSTPEAGTIMWEMPESTAEVLSKLSREEYAELVDINTRILGFFMGILMANVGSPTPINKLFSMELCAHLLRFTEFQCNTLLRLKQRLSENPDSDFSD